MTNVNSTDLPAKVTVDVTELYKLREEAALLEALRMLNIESWEHYDKALWLVDNDIDIWNIKQGWTNISKR